MQLGKPNALLSALAMAVLLSGCGNGIPSDVVKPYIMDGGERFISVPRADSIGDRFSYAFWAMPDQEDEADTVTYGLENTGYFRQHYVVFPEHGGLKNAGTGVSLGTNYVGVYEHRDAFFNARIAHKADLSGWHHYAVVYEKDACTLYVDAVKVGYAPRLNAKVKPWFSLGKVFGGNLPFEGQLDEFSLWSKVLTPEDIAEVMDHKLQGDEEALEIYYDFDDLSTLPGILDLSGHERHGMEQGYTHLSTDTASSGAAYSKLVEIDMKGAQHAMNYSVDRLTETSLDFEIAGWAFLPGKNSVEQSTYVLLRGKKDYFFTTETVKRNDLTQKYENDLDDCGFQARIRKADLEPDKYDIWLFIVKQNYFRQYHETQYSVQVK